MRRPGGQPGVAEGYLPLPEVLAATLAVAVSSRVTTKEIRATPEAHDRAMGYRGRDPATVLGWRLSPALRAAISDLRLQDNHFSQPVLAIGEVSGLTGSPLDQRQDSGPKIWMQEPLDAIVPYQMLITITDWLARVAE